jgi:hypothetical protein
MLLDEYCWLPATDVRPAKQTGVENQVGHRLLGEPIAL